MRKTSEKTSYDTYMALLQLFGDFMGHVRGRGEDRWSDNQELITVVWPGDISATIHFFIAHAQIILLTYGPPPPRPRRQPLTDDDNDDEVVHGDSDGSSTMHRLFRKLLAVWHPLPRAYLLDTSEEAVLVPDWLKLKMIRSEVDELVDSALQELEPHQLVLFIQSFGIPVASMTKLLQALDKAAQFEFDGVNEAVMDKTYMGQLVAVQHERGASGGSIFADRLGLNVTTGPPGDDDDDDDEFSGSEDKFMASRSPLDIPPRPTAVIPPGQVRAIVSAISSESTSLVMALLPCLCPCISRANC